MDPVVTGLTVAVVVLGVIVVGLSAGICYVLCSTLNIRY